MSIVEEPPVDGESPILGDQEVLTPVSGHDVALGLRILDGELHWNHHGGQGQRLQER